MLNELKGSCLCGAVEYEVVAEPIVVARCYCADCRKASGTSHGTHVAVPESAMSVTGKVRFFDKPADSGNIVSRGFCPTCGSAIYSKNKGMAGLLFIRASSLDDPELIAPQLTVYASRAPSWAMINHDTPVFQEMPGDMSMLNAE